MLTKLNHITLAISNLENSLDFYTRLLNFKGHVKWNTGAYLTLGELWLCLSLDQPDTKEDYTHIAFTLDEADFPSFEQQLLTSGVQQWKENISDGDSIYFLDPDGHKLEAHSGNLESRLNSLREKPYEGLAWLE